MTRDDRTQYSLSQPQTPETKRVTGALSVRLTLYRLANQGNSGWARENCRVIADDVAQVTMGNDLRMPLLWSLNFVVGRFL
jgi:hypothetical protein